MKNIRYLSFGIIVSFLTLLGGCTSPKATVNYTPVAAVPTIRSETGTSPNIAVVEFTHPTDETGKSSFKQFNGWDMEVDQILSDANVGLVFAEATVDALRKAGLQADVLTLSEYNTLKEQYDGVLTGDIQSMEIHIQPGWGAIAANVQISTLITVDLHNTQKSYGPILSESTQSGSGYGLMNQCSMAIDGAIQDYVRQFVRLMKTEKAF